MPGKVKKFFKDLGDRIKTSVRMRTESVFLIIALIIIITLGILVRCSPIFRTTALIKAFDPWIQYYNTNYLATHSLYEYFNWYSYQFWYPEGDPRYNLNPGLVFGAAILYKILIFFGINVTVYEVCYTWPVIMAGLTIFIAYLLGKEILNPICGLLTAFFTAFSPGYMQRTMLGFYDNETIGVFSLLAQFLFFIKAIKTGKSHLGVISGFFLGILTLSWGGRTYGFLIVPLTCLFLILANKYSSRLLIAYSTSIGTGLIMHLMLPGFKSSANITDMDILVPIGFFLLLLIFHIFDAQKVANPKFYNTVWRIIKWSIVPALIVFGVIFWLKPEWIPFGIGARFLSILNPTIRNEIHLVASVGEHKPSPWSVFYYNSLIPVILTPLGVYFAIKRNKEEDILMLVFSMTLLYFTGSMIRIILLLAPALALIGSYGLSYIVKFFGSLYRKEQYIARRRKRQLRKTLGSSEATLVFILVFVMLFTQVNHATTTSVQQMSWSEIVAGGYYHDWEETLTYIRENLHSTDVVVSWWDYGYWLSVIGNVTTVNDNQTKNHTRIGLTGMAFMQTDELISAKIFKKLHADYVLVYWGFLIGGLGGDEGKWPWMLRICNDHTSFYEKMGLREENWKKDTVFNESEYINSSSGLYEDKWFESTLVKLMFYGEPTSMSSASGSSLQSYYAAQIEGYEQQNISPRQDDNGKLWKDHIPENGMYDFKVFVPFYFSSNRLVKIYRVDYTALESSFEVLNPHLFENGIGYAEIRNTGLRDVNVTRVKVNELWYNYTIESGYETIKPGETKIVWFDTNQFNKEWEVGNPYNITVEVQAQALENRVYTFTNHTDNHAVEATPEYSIKIDRTQSKLEMESEALPIEVYLNVTNTGNYAVKVNELKVYNNEIDLLDPNHTNYIIRPGQTVQFKGTSVGGVIGFPYEIFVNTSEGAYDKTVMAVNLRDYSIDILPTERNIVPEELVLSENLRDFTRKLIYPDKNKTILYDNGTLIMQIKNTGTKIIGLEGISVNDEMFDWSDWDTINGDKILDPNEENTIIAQLPSVSPNEQYEIVVNATGQDGFSSASDVCTLIPVKDGKQIKIISSDVFDYSGVIANESVYVTVKNIGTEQVTIDRIELNNTGPIDLNTSNVEILYGNLVLNTFDVVKFRLNITNEIKINESDPVDLKVYTSTGETDTANFTAELPYGGEYIAFEDAETYADASSDKMYIKINIIGLHNMTLDTITINGTILYPDNVTFETGKNEFSIGVDNLITIDGSKFGFPDIQLGQIFEVKVVMIEGPVRTTIVSVNP
ncbi:MAG: STT3 domain-containing protein [Promethearchaeota archaeon]